MTDLKTLEENLFKLELHMKNIMDNTKRIETTKWKVVFTPLDSLDYQLTKMSLESIKRIYGNCKDGSYELALQMNGYELDK